MDVHVRPATPSDAGDVARLSTTLGYAAGEPEMRARLNRAASDPERAVRLAVDARGVVIGWIEVQSTEVLVSEPFALVTGLVVDAAVRGKGVGRLLVEAAEAWARERGLVALRLRTRVERADAHAFYERLGFELTKSQRVYRKSVTAG